MHARLGEAATGGACHTLSPTPLLATAARVANLARPSQNKRSSFAARRLCISPRSFADACDDSTHLNQMKNARLSIHTRSKEATLQREGREGPGTSKKKGILQEGGLDPGCQNPRSAVALWQPLAVLPRFGSNSTAIPAGNSNLAAELCSGVDITARPWWLPVLLRRVRRKRRGREGDGRKRTRIRHDHGPGPKSLGTRVVISHLCGRRAEAGAPRRRSREGRPSPDPPHRGRALQSGLHHLLHAP